ncbi:hypothetical protein [Piscinibacter gummiphilus]|uniref:Uncharacterized protein n=1 Tax=Piscinibacter gummiphilus TaxID=946333 RepID=A0ABZ0CPV4_9BURK|nr:hypothetical protein [Piscinibacter gummiphilus]WOB06924.1 hypothetical protein RXV79_18600 [Piscinibacter gummiphilus]
MSYDLHIVRLSDKSERTESPISEAQWKEAIRADGELQSDSVASATSPNSGAVIQVRSPLMASWLDPQTKLKHYFRYSRGRISVKNPPESVIVKMRLLAAKLGAKVQGDEGEFY